MQQNILNVTEMHMIAMGGRYIRTTNDRDISSLTAVTLQDINRYDLEAVLLWPCGCYVLEFRDRWEMRLMNENSVASRLQYSMAEQREMLDRMVEYHKQHHSVPLYTIDYTHDDAIYVRDFKDFLDGCKWERDGDMLEGIELSKKLLANKYVASIFEDESEGSIVCLTQRQYDTFLEFQADPSLFKRGVDPDDIDNAISRLDSALCYAQEAQEAIEENIDDTANEDEQEAIDHIYEAVNAIENAMSNLEYVTKRGEF